MDARRVLMTELSAVQGYSEWTDNGQLIMLARPSVPLYTTHACAHLLAMITSTVGRLSNSLPIRLRYTIKLDIRSHRAHAALPKYYVHGFTARLRGSSSDLTRRRPANYTVAGECMESWPPALNHSTQWRTLAHDNIVTSRRPPPPRALRYTIHYITAGFYAAQL